jgi:hypothetical protein
MVLIFFKNTFISLIIASAIFIILNLVAALYLIKNQKDETFDGGEYFYSGKDSIKISKMLHQGESGITYDPSPNPTPHTLVDLISTASPSYKVGIEGIRYLDSWDDEHVKKSLSNSPIFVIGGSTTFGDRVKNDHTLPGYLNYLDTNNTYLNFGTGAYDSIREINRLIYLLKKGYRPKKVIFIDGLNDITNFGRSPYNIHDTPNFWGFFRRGPSDIQIIFGHLQEKNTIHAYSNSLPIIQLIKHIQFYKKNLGKVYERHSGDFSEPNLLKKLLEYYWYWPSIQINWRENLSRDIIQHYKQSIIFTEALGRGFGFSVDFVYQPIGLAEKNNPFIKAGFENSNLFKIHNHVDLRLKSAILNGNLGMKDCSRSFADKTPNVYWVDPTHYSPRGNLLLAKCILNAIDRKN